MRTRIWGVMLLSTGIALAAAGAMTCGGDDAGGQDAGGDTDGTSGCTANADCPGGYCMEGRPKTCEPLPVLTADMSCLRNNPPPPTGTGTVSATVFVEDFEDGYMVEGATIDLFFDNVFDDTPDATIGPTNSSGEARVTGVPRFNLIAYRIRGGTLSTGDEIKTTIEYDVETPDADGGRIRTVSVADNTYRLIQTVLGIRPTPDHGIIAGEFDDCDGGPGDPPAPVEGIIARLLNAAREDCHYLDDHECYSRYFQEEMPARLENQPYSSADGLFAVAEVPPGDWTIQILGRLSAETEAELLGEKLIRATANAIVIVDVNPLAE